MPPDFCVVLPVYRPDLRHLEAQIASVRGQTVASVHVVFVVSDRSSAGAIRELAAAAGLTFSLVEPAQDLDAPRAVEAGLYRALRIGGPDTLIALCDQDDIWHPDRLQRGRSALPPGGPTLAHSDARLVDQDGKVIHRSMFRFEGRLPKPGLRGLLMRNAVTGMTMTMRRKLVELAVPFPPQAGVHFYHDLWLALLAEATDGIALIPQATVDYRQHGGNVMGAIDRRRGPRLRVALPDAAWLRREAAGYALARYLAHSVNNRLANGVASGQLRHGEAKVQPLRPYLARMRGAGSHLWDAGRMALTGNLRLARTALAFATVSLGRAVWSLREALGPGLRSAVDRFDERLYSLSPGVLPVVPRYLAPSGDKGGAQEPADPARTTTRAMERIVDARKTARFRIEMIAATPSVVILVPTLNPSEIFAGIVTALDIGCDLAAQGLAVRLVATDLPVSSVDASRRFVEGRLAPAARGAGDRIAVDCGVTSGSLMFHPDDRFLASAWWTAHLADRLLAQGFRKRGFHYLLQDYEPNFYAWGPEFADASASYALSFTPIFNTTTLRDYFALQGHAFASPGSLCFHPAVDIAEYATGARPPRPARRRLAVYGRPAVPRNMFPTAVEALNLFLAAEGLTPDQIELVSVGMLHDRISLTGGHALASLGKLPLHDYPPWLRTVDIGLSLMLSPHPSHPPLEMAASGVRVVTNRFANKDLGRLTPAILSMPGTPEGIAEGLSRAWAMAPVAEADRHFDLTALGAPLSQVTARLAADLRPMLKAG
ncbi:MAG: rhamnosyltransferase WsaF family glycosyltransferase [Gemmobacter sp.]